jgi:hypothetical protein
MIFHVLMAGLLGACPTAGPRNLRIHVSEHYRVASPDCRWWVEITPPADDSDAGAQVVLADHGTGAVRDRFVLDRDGVLHWSADGQTLVVDNEAFSNHYRLMMFRPVESGQSDSAAFEVDRVIRADVERRLTPGAVIEFYFPRFESFSDGAVVVSVSVITAQRGAGAFTEWCFGYAVTPRPLALARREGASCQ